MPNECSLLPQISALDSGLAEEIAHRASNAETERRERVSREVRAERIRRNAEQIGVTWGELIVLLADARETVADMRSQIAALEAEKSAMMEARQ